jgi:signal transduction histidine kinase/ActR/RegA family two-component response regulator
VSFDRLFESVQVGVYIGTLSPTASKTLSANPHLKLIFGYPGDAPASRVRPFDLERFVDPQARTALIERLTADGTVTDYVLRLKRADDTTVWVELTGRADPPDKRGALKIVTFVRDVSERRKLDDQTRSLHHQLLQAEKMAALGQTISGVAHELNNPLATILSWAERLSQRSDLDSTAQRGVSIVLSEAERASRIVRNLLTFARKRQTTRMMVEVNRVIRETLALRAYEQRVNNVEVVVALAEGLPQVFADGHQIQQVLLNLVINAEQAMTSASGRGVLVVRTWHDAQRNAIVIEVNDDGPGIPEGVQPKIFDPFFTTKEVGQGTGLGLTVAYAIVQEHGGRLRLESREGGGASFYVELPIAGGPLPKSDPPIPRPSLIDPTAGGSILVVEDEAGLAGAVLDALRDAGYDVEHASDGEAALAAVGTRSFDLVICDLKMPRVDGKAFYRRLSTRAPSLARKVVFVTGDVAGMDAEGFFAETGCRWLAKPFRLADLLRTVKEEIGAARN